MPRQLAQAPVWPAGRAGARLRDVDASSCWPWAARPSAPSSSPPRRAIGFVSRSSSIATTASRPGPDPGTAGRRQPLRRDGRDPLRVRRGARGAAAGGHHHRRPPRRPGHRGRRAAPPLQAGRPAARRDRLWRRTRPRVCSRLGDRGRAGSDRTGRDCARGAARAPGPSVETDANPAKQLAWSIFGCIPVIYGHGRWPRRRTDGRPSSTRTPRRGPPGSRCQRPTTTRSRAASTPRAVGRALRRRAPRSRRAGRDERYRVVEELLGERATNRSEVWAEARRRWRARSAPSPTATC